MGDPSMHHPERYSDYYEPILAGEAVPSVYNSLVEAAIRGGVVPERISTAWSLRESLWSAVSLAGAVLLLFHHWWLGLAIMGFSLWAVLRHTKPLHARLGYCAAVDHELGIWAMARGYLSLRVVPSELRETWRARNSELLERAETDAYAPVGKLVAMADVVLTGVLYVSKVTVAVLLLASAWRQPGWLTIGVGGVIAGFFVLQSLARLPFMLAPIALIFRR